MSTQTAEVASLALAGGQSHVAIDSVTTITLPTAQQRLPRILVGGTGTSRSVGGTLSMYLSVETQNARFTLSGVNPTTANGVLLAANSVTVFRGENQIAALKIIGAAAGGFINYEFVVDEVA